MSTNETNYSREHLEGSVDIRRQANPTLRGSSRRNDPDGGNSQAYVSGLTGTSLTVNVSPVGDLVANFVSDDWQAAIDLINGLSAANLLASDDEGFLRLTNLNGGEDNHIQVVSGDAAPLLGLITSPEPGSIAFAGDVETAPPGVYSGEFNPQGTALIAGDENLRARAVNRGLAATLLQLARVFKELDVEVPVVRELDVTISVGVGASPFVHIEDPSIRVPINLLGIAVTNPDAQLLSVASITHLDGKTIHDMANDAEPVTRVDGIFSHDGSATALNDAASFSVWGTPDGGSIFGPAVAAKDKQPQVAITSVRGNVIQADTATFQTNGVQAGDTVEVADATNTSPFSHNGEFVVLRVLDETRLEIRAKSEFEDLIGASTARPTRLNDSTTGVPGNVRVFVGNYVSAEFGVSFRLTGLPDDIANNANAKLRVISGAKLRDLDPSDLSLSLWPSPVGLSDVVRQHVETGEVAAGSETLRHTGTQVDYAGGGTWADGTANPATTVEAQLDKILTDLAGAGNDGAARVRALAVGSLAAGTVRAQLSQLASEWLKLDRNDDVSGNPTFSGTPIIQNLLDITGQARLNNSSGSATLLSSQVPGAGSIIYLWEVSTGAGKGLIRFYVDQFGLIITQNAVWSAAGSTWSRDVAQDSFAVRIGENLLDLASDNSGIAIQQKRVADNASPWADNTWHPLSTFGGDNGVQINNPGVNSPALWGETAAGTLWSVFIDPHGGLFRTGLYFFDDFVGENETALAGPIWSASNNPEVRYVNAPRHHVRLRAQALFDQITMTVKNADVTVEERPLFRCRLTAMDVTNSAPNRRHLIAGFWSNGAGGGPYFFHDPEANVNWQVILVGDANSPLDTGVPGPTDLTDVHVLMMLISGDTTVEWMILDGRANQVSRVGMASSILGSGTFTLATPISGILNPFHIAIWDEQSGGSNEAYVDYVELLTLHRDSFSGE